MLACGPVHGWLNPQLKVKESSLPIVKSLVKSFGPVVDRDFVNPLHNNVKVLELRLVAGDAELPPEKVTTAAHPEEFFAGVVSEEEAFALRSWDGVSDVRPAALQPANHVPLRVDLKPCPTRQSATPAWTLA